MKNNTYRIGTETREDRRILLTFLIGMGYVWHRGFNDNSTSPVEIDEKYPWGEYPSVMVETETKEISGVIRSTIMWPAESVEIIRYFTPPLKEDVTIHNVGDYSAQITSSGIRVGCQLISFEKFREIVEAVDQYQKD